MSDLFAWWWTSGHPEGPGADLALQSPISAQARRAFDAGRAAERQRILPLLLALHHLYNVVWHQIGTVDLSHVAPGYNGISYDDDNAIDAAAQPVEALLATGEFADLLDGDGDE